jgi:predicted ATP-binding protein involved in virulence
MKIENLIIRNFRRYDDATFHFHETFNVLIGNNGKGKTTILDALAIMLNTYFQGSDIPTGGSGIKTEDARLVVRKKEGQVFREWQSEVWLKASAHIDGQTWIWQREKGDRGGKAKDIVNLGALAREEVRQGKNKNMPLLLYYGSGRLWNIHRNIQTEKPGSQLDAYRYCLDPKSDQNAFEKWFKKLAFSELQKKQKIPALDAVRDAVLCCTPGASHFYHDTDEDELMIELSHEGLIPFNYLSDGFRNMVAMVADIAHRASRLNPHLASNAAKETSGVVLIDEIDLHLHPKWQRRVVTDLQKAFPALQFIATTHSPFILQSLEPGQVIDLEQVVSVGQVDPYQSGVAAPGPGHAFSNRPLEDIVEEIMNVPVPQRCDRYQQMYEAAKAYYLILQESKTADENQKQQLKRKLDELSAPYSDNVAYHAFLEMERMASGLGKTASEGE